MEHDCIMMRQDYVMKRVFCLLFFRVESEDPLGLDSYLKEELDSMNQVLEQFN